jgi:hypothetical protein
VEHVLKLNKLIDVKSKCMKYKSFIILQFQFDPINALLNYFNESVSE